jgi:Domain of unknown function (DUF5134)
MHHDSMGGQAVFVPALLLGMLALATVVHARAGFAGRPCGNPRHASGHALMAAGMACMLLPAEWRIVPNVALALVFGVSAAYFLGASVLAWRTGGSGVGWYSEVAFGDLAMIYMLGPSRLVTAPVTVFLVLYFCIYAALFGMLVLWRGLVIDLPGEGRTPGRAVPKPLARLATVSSPLSTASAAAHLATGAVMVHMLAGLRA